MIVVPEYICEFIRDNHPSFEIISHNKPKDVLVIGDNQSLKTCVGFTVLKEISDIDTNEVSIEVSFNPKRNVLYNVEGLTTQEQFTLLNESSDSPRVFLCNNPINLIEPIKYGFYLMYSETIEYEGLKEAVQENLSIPQGIVEEVLNFVEDDFLLINNSVVEILNKISLKTLVRNSIYDILSGRYPDKEIKIAKKYIQADIFSKALIRYITSEISDVEDDKERIEILSLLEYILSNYKYFSNWDTLSAVLARAVLSLSLSKNSLYATTSLGNKLGKISKKEDKSSFYESATKSKFRDKETKDKISYPKMSVHKLSQMLEAKIVGVIIQDV